MRDLHDSSFKLWFDHPRMVQDLLRGFLPADLAVVFDFDTLEQMSAEYVGDDLRQSRGDMLWRVRFRAEAGREWLYLLVLLEFQSTVDRHMAARVLAYTGQTYLKLIRGEEAPAPDGKLPPVLPIVLYNGRARWSAPGEMSETIAAVGSGLAPFQPRQRYLLIDEHAMRAEDLPSGNVVSAQIELEQGSMEAMEPALRELDGLLAGRRYASLRRGFAEWARRMVERRGTAVAPSGLAGALEALEETGDLGAMASLLAERWDEYLKAKVETDVTEALLDITESIGKALKEEGIESMERLDEIIEQRLRVLARRREAESMTARLEASARQERAMLLHQTARKFDAETAERLAMLLGRMHSPGRLVRIAEQVIDCSTGAELLACARRVVEEDRQPEDRREPRSGGEDAAP